MDNGMPQGSVVSINEPPGSQVMPAQDERKRTKKKAKKVNKAKVKSKSKKRSRR